MFNFFSQPDETFINAGKFKEISATQPGVVIDVRTSDEYNAGHLKIADLQLDWLKGELNEAMDQLDKETTYYLYCRSGSRSSQAIRMLRNNGFKNAFNIGSYNSLINAGLESE
ncbi:MAG: rhodanese-like domain-containing protein [Balneolales bacterium]